MTLSTLIIWAKDALLKYGDMEVFTNGEKGPDVFAASFFHDKTEETPGFIVIASPDVVKELELMGAEERGEGLK